MNKTFSTIADIQQAQSVHQQSASIPGCLNPKINKSSEPAPSDRSIKPALACLGVFVIPIVAVTFVNTAVSGIVQFCNYAVQHGWW